MLPVNSEVLQLQSGFTALALVLCLALLELGEGHGLDGVENLVLTAGHRPKEFNLDLSLDLVLAEVRRAYLHLVPLEGTAFGALDLRLVDGGVLTRGQIPVNDEEAKRTIRQRGHRVEHDNLSIRSRRLFLSTDDHVPILTRSSLLIDQGFRHNLIPGCDHLVHLEFKRANEVLCAQVFLIFIIVRIIHFHLEHLLLFKVKIDHNLGDELRVQIVMDDLCLADFLPHVAHLLEQDAERI